MSIIRLENMRFYSQHGCFDEEQAIGTHFRVDMALTVDTTAAQRSDQLEDTVNYLAVYRQVQQAMAQPSHLLEHVANRIGETVMADYPAVQHLSVKVSKLNPPLGGQLEAVSVELSKDRATR